MTRHPTTVDRYRAAVQREINLADRGEPLPFELLGEIAAGEAEFTSNKLERLVAEALGHVASMAPIFEGAFLLTCSCGWSRELTEADAPAVMHAEHIELSIDGLVVVPGSPARGAP